MEIYLVMDIYRVSVYEIQINLNHFDVILHISLHDRHSYNELFKIQ